MAKKKTTKTSSTSAPADIGLIGLAVMGQNLALNMADHGFKVAVYNRTTEKMLDFVREVDAKEPSKDNIIGVADFKQFVKSIKRPRRIIIMVQAGRGTDAVIDQLTKVCGQGRHHHRWRQCQLERHDSPGEGADRQGIRVHRHRVSGGEVGARFGPSTMPGGAKQAWKHLQPVWKAIAPRSTSKTGRELLGSRAGQAAQGRRIVHGPSDPTVQATT
jgi:6-phosphogluconate dehydrogenase